MTRTLQELLQVTYFCLFGWILISDQTEANICPKGKFYEEGNKCYFTVSHKWNWDAASSSCSSTKGGNLASIKSQAELDFLYQHFNLGTENWWIGLNDMDMDGVYSWKADGSKLSQFTKWAVGHPKLNAPHVDMGTEGKVWTSSIGSQRLYQSICEVANVNRCLHNNGECDHNCEPGFESRKCSCRVNYTLIGATECFLKCENNNGGCDQICLDSDKVRGDRKCHCTAGFTLLNETGCSCDKPGFELNSIGFNCTIPEIAEAESHTLDVTLVTVVPVAIVLLLLMIYTVLIIKNKSRSSTLPDVTQSEMYNRKSSNSIWSSWRLSVFKKSVSFPQDEQAEEQSIGRYSGDRRFSRD